MLYILTGQDDFSLTLALEEIKRELGDKEIVATSTTTLDGRQVTSEQLSTVCETAPFLGGRRLVIIKGLLERFEPRGRSRRQQKTARVNTRQDESKSFTGCIEKIPDSTTLVLIEGRITKSNPLYKVLASKAVVKSFPALRDARLRQWIQRRVTEEGASISSRAVDLLIELVGSNLWVMASEIGKLVLFASGRRIEEGDIETLVSYAQQADVFAMVDAIVAFKTEVAERLLERLLQKGAAPAYLLFMLSRQVRMMVRARELRGQGKSRTEIQSKLGLTSEFALERTLEQANRYSLPLLKEVYRQLLEADLSIKTGRYDGELALNILIAELGQRSAVRA